MTEPSSDVNPNNVTSDSRYPSTPAWEFYAYHSSSMAPLLFTWLLVFFPLVLGRNSLMWSFFLFLPTALFLNILLFFRAMTLPNHYDGIQYLFTSHSLHYENVDTWERWFRATMGTWVGAEYGCLFFLGKYVGEKTFVFPHLLIGGVLILATCFLNLFKIAALASYHARLYESEQIESSIQGFVQSSHIFKLTPVLLSQLPAAPFWLMVHFLFVACSKLPFYSFAFETVASCFAEMLPARFSDRQKFPQNLVVTVPLGLLSLNLSAVFYHGHTKVFTGRLYNIFYFSHMMAYYLIISLVILIILPLSLCNVANLGRYERLIAFLRRQTRPTWASSFPITFTTFSILVGGCLILTVPFHIYWNLLGPVGFFSNSAINGMLAVYFVCIILLVFVVFIVLGVVIQCILKLVDGEKHPCCMPLGRPIAIEDE